MALTAVHCQLNALIPNERWCPSRDNAHVYRDPRRAVGDDPEVAN
jgi:hypothetical protein